MIFDRTDAAAPAPALELDDVSVTYGSRRAVQHARLSVAPGELMALVGPSGCGKSSLLAAINRMTDLIPGCSVSGDIRIDGASVMGPGESLPLLRRRVGMVFQQPNPFLLSIADNLHFPLREHGIDRRCVVESGATEHIFTTPGHPVTQAYCQGLAG